MSRLDKRDARDNRRPHRSLEALRRHLIKHAKHKLGASVAYEEDINVLEKRHRREHRKLRQREEAAA